MMPGACNSDARRVYKEKKTEKRRIFLPTCCWNTSSAIHLIKVVGIWFPEKHQLMWISEMFWKKIRRRRNFLVKERVPSYIQKSHFTYWLLHRRFNRYWHSKETKISNMYRTLFHPKSNFCFRWYKRVNTHGVNLIQLGNNCASSAEWI